MKQFLFLLTLFLAQTGNAQDCFETHTIKSKALNEKRNIWIGLPTNYHADSSYSTIYVLDAEDRFAITYSITKELFENQHTIPQVIVVGIPNVNKLQRLSEMTFTDSKVNATGKEDTIGYFSSTFTGDGLSFLCFLEDEVVTFVNDNYSTSDFNTLIGHSIGGYFCTYILPIQKSFSAFQIYDPSIWFNEGDAINHLQKKLDRTSQSKIFISKGTAFDGPRENVEHHLNMIDSLRIFLKSYPLFTVTTASYEKEHNAMFLYSLMDGLTALFTKEE
jgi:predicted alpha/beta superfamily hydrolase